MEVDDVHPGMQILEDPDPVAAAWTRPPVSSAPSGEIALGDDRQPRRWKRDAMMQGGDGDPPTRLGQIDGGTVDDGQVDAVVEQHLAKAVRRTRSVGSDDDPVLLGQQLGEAASEAGSVACDGTPSGRLDDRRVRRLGCRVDRPERAAAASEEAVRLGVQAGEREVALAAPRRRQGGGEVVFLGEQVDGSVAAAPRLDEDHLGGLRQHVGQQRWLGAVVEPRQPTLHPFEERPLGDALPLLPSPRLAGDQAAGPLTQVVARQQLACREDQRLGKVADGPLVVDPERGQSVDLIAPQVDTHGGVTGGREHVDDRSSAGELSTVLDQFLAAVPEVDEPVDELVGIDDGAVAHRDRLGGQGAGPEALQKGAHAGHDHPWAALRVREFARAPRGAGPSSPPTD